MPRSEFPRAVRELAWERSQGICEGLVWFTDVYTQERLPRRCGAPVDVGCFHFDHRVPDWIGPNRNTLENCQVLCLTCHTIKTKDDLTTIAKIKRIRKGPHQSRHPLPGGRSSELKKTLRGKVVRRSKRGRRS
jgi:hypothetical protein